MHSFLGRQTPSVLPLLTMHGSFTNCLLRTSVASGLSFGQPDDGQSAKLPLRWLPPASVYKENKTKDQALVQNAASASDKVELGLFR